MSVFRILLLSGAVVALTVNAPAVCRAQQVPSAAQPAPASPDVHKQGDVSYVSGGVGDDSERAMKAIAKDFNLHITLATPTGEYLAGTKLQIAAGSGKTVLDATSGGPLFYAELPPGKYTIRAMGPQGQTKSETVDVTSAGHAAVLINLSA
jgi:hypothetical protein